MHCFNILKSSRLDIMSSITFYKYCGNGFGEERPLEVGQKQAIVKVTTLDTKGFLIFINIFFKDMEKNVQGYKALRQEIKDLR